MSVGLWPPMVCLLLQVCLTFCPDVPENQQICFNYLTKASERDYQITPKIAKLCEKFSHILTALLPFYVF